jgi:hypothetical protein
VEPLLKLINLNHMFNFRLAHDHRHRVAAMRDIDDPIIAAEDPQAARYCFIGGCRKSPPRGMFHVFEIAANHGTGARIHGAVVAYSPFIRQGQPVGAAWINQLRFVPLSDGTDDPHQAYATKIIAHPEEIVADLPSVHSHGGICAEQSYYFRRHPRKRTCFGLLRARWKPRGLYELAAPHSAIH